MIMNVAKHHVGKTKPGKVSWVAPAVRDAIKKMNKLRKNVSNNRKEWLDACQEARMVIIHAKEEAWRVSKTPLPLVITGNCGE